MRRLIATALVLATALTGLVVPAAERAGAESCKATDGAGNEVEVACGGAGGQGDNGGGPTYQGPLVTAVSTVNGQACTILASPTSDQGSAAVALQNGITSFPVIGPALGALWQAIVSLLPGCPGATIDPEAVAFSFVRTMAPPSTGPRIAPGHAITGKAAFLEQATTAATQQFDTVLGPLTITLRATEFTVDWGDRSGRDPGPFTSPGGPWPDGAARHTYTEAGRYDVVLTQRWSAHWEIPGVQAGDIAGVTSTDTIPRFEARQLQAVRDR
jgi:hypothetical protein